ncbi:glycosyltransferase family 4 protein [Patescibacteria group bacterium]
MKILFITKYFYPHIGGVEKHIEEVSGRLIKKGHQVTVLTFKHDQQSLEIETRGGIKIIRIPYLNSKFSTWKNIINQKNLIQQAGIVHIHDIFFTYLPLRFIFPLKPTYITFHGWEGEFPIPLKNIFIRKLSEKLTKGNICIGDYIKKWYKTKPDFVTYGGCTVSRHQLHNSKNITQITFIGRLEEVNSIKEYLEALTMLKQQHNFKITFVGDGSYKKQAQKLGKVTGMVKGIDKYLKKPSFIFASSYLTILEAMVAGLPVFALYTNPLKKDYLKLFSGAEFINISSSVDELTKQVKNSLQRHALKVKKGQSFAKKQTWDKVTNIYLQLWKKN